MRALVLEEFGGPFVSKDVPTPAIAPHEALDWISAVTTFSPCQSRHDRVGGVSRKTSADDPRALE